MHICTYIRISTVLPKIFREFQEICTERERGGRERERERERETDRQTDRQTDRDRETETETERETKTETGTEIETDIETAETDTREPDYPENNQDN